ncbi:MAG: hypothetical protein R2759_17915 [Bacteroidales bacterium]
MAEIGDAMGAAFGQIMQAVQTGGMEMAERHLQSGMPGILINSHLIIVFRWPK